MFGFRNIESRIKKEEQFREVQWHQDFWECIEDLARHPVVLRMKLYHTTEAQTVISTV